MAAAAVATFNPGSIPGLGQPLTEADICKSRLTYNGLPSIENQVQLQDKYGGHIKAILDIIGRHSMGHVFRVHSAHRHGTIPSGAVRLEANMGTNGFTWNRAMTIKDPNYGKVHATFFKIDDKGLTPFEFAEGPSPVAGSDVTAEFLAEMATYIITNELGGLVSLEVGDFAKPAKTAELEIQWGDMELITMAVPVSVLAHAVAELVPTGWNLNPTGPCDPDGEPDPGTHWAKVIKPKETHKVFIDAADPVTPELLTTKLIEMGLIKS